jgi:hypothetical protein
MRVRDRVAAAKCCLVCLSPAQSVCCGLLRLRCLASDGARAEILGTVYAVFLAEPQKRLRQMPRLYQRL